MSSLVVCVLAIGAVVACAGPPQERLPGSSQSAAQSVVFVADVVAAAERLPPGDLEASCTGKVMVTIDPTRRPPLNLSTARFDLTLAGCAADTVITDLHIHKGSEAVLALSAEVISLTLTNGSGSGRATNSSVKPTIIDELVGDPAMFYVNLHSRRHPAGFMRGELRRG